MPQRTPAQSNVPGREPPPRRGIVFHGTAVLTSNLAFAIVCLVGLRVSFNATASKVYAEFLIFVGMAALSNYALLGLPEVLIRYTGERGTRDVRFLAFLRRALLLVIPMSLALFLASLLAAAFSTRSTLARLALFWALTITPQSCLILMRAYLETHFHQLLSSLINGFVKSILYFSPALAVTFRLSANAYGVIYFIALVLAFAAIYAHPVFRQDGHRTTPHKGPKMPSLRAGLGINAVGALSVLGPLLDRIIAVHFISAAAAIEVAIVSELCARFAIIYGTMGQFLFPHLALRVTQFYRSFRRLVSVSVLLYVIGVGILATGAILIEWGHLPLPLPEWARINRAGLIALIIIVTTTGVSSLLMRPLFLLRREWRLVVGHTVTVSATAIAMALFGDSAVMMLILMGLRAVLDLSIYTTLYASHNMVAVAHST